MTKKQNDTLGKSTVEQVMISCNLQEISLHWKC